MLLGGGTSGPTSLYLPPWPNSEKPEMDGWSYPYAIWRSLVKQLYIIRKLLLAGLTLWLWLIRQIWFALFLTADAAADHYCISLLHFLFCLSCVQKQQLKLNLLVFAAQYTVGSYYNGSVSVTPILLGASYLPRLCACWPLFAPLTFCPSPEAKCEPLNVGLSWALTTAWWVHLLSQSYSSSIIHQPSQVTPHKHSVIVLDPVSH